MERLTAIFDDNVIIYEGQTRKPDGLFSMYPELHAIQCYPGGQVGIEYRDGRFETDPEQGLVLFNELKALWEASAPPAPKVFYSLTTFERQMLTEASPCPDGFSPDKPVHFLIEEYKQAIQLHLDQTARERDYGNITNMCTYATSTNAQWAAEGQAGVEWRDAVWVKCYEILDDFQTGNIPAPTLEDIMAQLPQINWPA